MFLCVHTNIHLSKAIGMGETIDEAFSEAEDDAGDRLEADECQFYECLPIEVERKFVIVDRRQD